MATVTATSEETAIITARESNVGWIGTDLLSKSTAIRLSSCGYFITIYNPFVSSASLQLDGVLHTESIGSVIKSSSLIVLPLRSSENLRHVPEILLSLTPNSTLLLLTSSFTIDPSLVDEISEKVKSSSSYSIDAVLASETSIVCGGDPLVIERFSPVFKCIGFEDVQCLGRTGAGVRARMAQRVFLATTMLGLVEGLAYVKKSVVNASKWLEWVGGCGKLVEVYGKKIVDRVMEEQGEGVKVKELVEDLGVCLKECEKIGVVVPGLALARQLYISLVLQEHGELGLHALTLAIERLSNGDDSGKNKGIGFFDATLRAPHQAIVGISKRKIKANWTPELHNLFIFLCRNQVLAGNKSGTSLNKIGWQYVVDEFHKKTGVRHDKKQFKNHWDNTREQWRIWRKLIDSIPESRLDLTNGVISQSDEWWFNYLQVHPEASQFRNKALPQVNLLDTLFSTTSTTIETTTSSTPALESNLPNVGLDSSMVFTTLVPATMTGETTTLSSPPLEIDGPDNTAMDGNNDEHVPKLVNVKIQNTESPYFKEFKSRREIKSCISNRKLKANWTPELHKLFVCLCLDQVAAGNRPGTCLNKAGWKCVMDRFYMNTGLVYDKKQFKNHWNNTKEQWKIWKKLSISCAGLILDPVTQMVSQSEEWWTDYLQMHPEAAQFRFKGLTLVDSLDTLFSNIATSEATTCAGGNSPLLTATSQNVDMGSSRAPSAQINNLEGNGTLTCDTRIQIEESPFPHDGLSAEPPSRRRKISHSSGHSSFTPNKQDVQSARLNTKLVRLCKAIESRNKTVEVAASVAVPKEEYTMKHCIELLDEIPEILQGSDPYMFALDMFLKKEHRELFVLLGNSQMRHRWLTRQQLKVKSSI